MPPKRAAGGPKRPVRHELLDPARSTTRLLRAALAIIALLVSARLTVEMLLIPIWGVDVVIPLKAAARWLAGGEPYLASSFLAGPGFDVPYLYPPLLLPPFAVAGQLPVVLVIVAANAACAVAAYIALRRLGLPPWAVAAAFLWPPVSGTIQGGNMQLPLFTAFIWLYWSRSRFAFRPEARIPGEDDRPALADGLLAAIIPAVKVSQAHAWVALLRFRPRAALLGLATLGLVAVLLLPVAGIGTWIDWLAQSARATDPSWALAGSSLTSGAPPAVTLAVAVATMVATLFVPRRRAGLWIGLLTIIGAPSLRMYGVLFAVPAMLEIRRELALVAAILIATYTNEGLWLGIAIITLANLAAPVIPALLEPAPRVVDEEVQQAGGGAWSSSAPAPNDHKY